MTSHFMGMALEVNTSKSTFAKNTECATSHEHFFFSLTVNALHDLLSTLFYFF